MNNKIAADIKIMNCKEDLSPIRHGMLEVSARKPMTMTGGRKKNLLEMETYKIREESKFDGDHYLSTL
jgi:hypothetical protein